MSMSFVDVEVMMILKELNKCGRGFCHRKDDYGVKFT